MNRLSKLLIAAALTLCSGLSPVLAGDAVEFPRINSRPNAAETAEPGLEMSEVARQFPTHAGPTTFYINFDGWHNHDGKGHDIQPFRGTTNNRERDIQEILFRTAEIFAPFNVRVVRSFGEGVYDKDKNGNTTVFVGADTADVDKNGKKYTKAVTPSKSMDGPHGTKAANHRPDSNPYHLAFVDPMAEKKDGSGWVNAMTNIAIARHIGHEGGHTFGLAHVLSKGQPELMAYDANLKCRFVNRAYPTTDLNFDPVSKTKKPAPELTPRWGNQKVTTENAFAYLWAVLGPRPADGRAHVADADAIDSSVSQPTQIALGSGDAQSGEIDVPGDYEVFQVASDHWPVDVRLRPSPGGRLRAVLFAFDAKGHKLAGFDKSDDGGPVCRVRLNGPKGEPVYTVVVGAADGSSTGAFELSVGEALARR